MTEYLYRIVDTSDIINVSDNTRDTILKWITGSTNPPPVSLDEVIRLYIKCQRETNIKHKDWTEKHRQFLAHIPKLYRSVQKEKHHYAMILTVQAIEMLMQSLYCMLESD